MKYKKGTRVKIVLTTWGGKYGTITEDAIVNSQGIPTRSIKIELDDGYKDGWHHESFDIIEYKKGMRVKVPSFNQMGTITEDGTHEAMKDHWVSIKLDNGTEDAWRPKDFEILDGATWTATQVVVDAEFPEIFCSRCKMTIVTNQGDFCKWC